MGKCSPRISQDEGEKMNKEKVYIDGANFTIYEKNGKLYGEEKDVPLPKPEKSFVHIEKVGDSLLKAMNRGLEKIKIEEIIKPADRVAIKVNLGGGITGVPSSMTDIEVVKGVVDKVREIGADCFVCEANMRTLLMTPRLLKKRGYDDFPKKKGVPFINLSEGRTVEFQFRDVDLTVYLPEVLLRPEVKIFSVPPPKHHWECGVTLAEKNMYGAISDRRKGYFHLHHRIDKIVAGAARIMQPTLSIIGAKKACAGLGPHFCVPIDFNCIIFSNNMLAADKVGAEILGYPYEEIIHAMINDKSGVNFEFLPDSMKIEEIDERIRKNFRDIAIKPKNTKFWRRMLALNYYTPTFINEQLRHVEFIATWVNKFFFERKMENIEKKFIYKILNNRFNRY